MNERILAVLAEGYTPVIYIDGWLAKQQAIQAKLNAIIKQAGILSVKVVLGKEVLQLHTLNKLHVFRYGSIPVSTEAIVLSLGGRIVPGPF